MSVHEINHENLSISGKGKKIERSFDLKPAYYMKIQFVLVIIFYIFYIFRPIFSLENGLKHSFNDINF